VPLWLVRLLVRVRATLFGGRDRELRDEMQLHLHLLEEEYVAQGMTSPEARRRACQEFGNATLYQEASHDLFSFRLLEDLAQDVRYALRELRRTAAFTTIAVVSLAVGIGAVTTTFTIVDAFMLRGLPVREPDRLVALSTAGSPTWVSWPYSTFARWRTLPQAVVEIAAASDVSTVASTRASQTAKNMRVTLVSSNYFRVMGVRPWLGRSFEPHEDSVTSRAAVAVISDGLWAKAFGRSPDILSRTIGLNGLRYSIVGVAEHGFVGHEVGRPTDVWIPLGMRPVLFNETGDERLDERATSGPPWLKVLGRVGPGIDLAQATAAVNLARQLLVSEQSAVAGTTDRAIARARTQQVALLPATKGFAPERVQYARPLLVLSGITGLVLLVACVNFSNLMLARSESRRKEFVIRLALGGGRGRLIRQAATECTLLALAAGALGLVLAYWAATLVAGQFALSVLPLELAVQIDGRIVSFAALCAGVVIAFGLWPCTRPARSAVVSSVRQANTRERKPRSLAGRAILIGQLAMCTIILIVAGLFVRTVTNLRSQDLGFDKNVLLLPLHPADTGYTDETSAMLVRQITERLSAVPGVRATGVTGPALLDISNYWIDSSQQLKTDRGMAVGGSRWTSASVGPGFFEAAGIPLIRGRTFADADMRPDGGGLIINQSLAKTLFGTADPIGRHLGLNARGRLRPIVGVVSDATQTSPRHRGLGVVYVPLQSFRHVVLAVRTTGAPTSAVPLVTHHVRALAPDLSIGTMRTMSEALEDAIAQERLVSGISLLLGVLVITIGCVGLFALITYDVGQRTHELGVRLALGATSQGIMAMVLKDSCAIALASLVIGVPLGVAVSRLMSAQLFGVLPYDPWTIAAVAAVLTTIALLAALRPARSAAQVDPLLLLHHD
jgi:predicted permease